MFENSADESKIRETKQRQREALSDESADLRDLMSTPQGLRFLYRLRENYCHWDRPDAHNSGSWTYHNIGKKDVWRELYEDLKRVDPDIEIKLAQIGKDVYVNASKRG